MGGKVSIAIAWVCVWSFQGGANYLEQIFVSPIVFGDEGPEGDDQGIDLFVRPKRPSLSVHFLLRRRGGGSGHGFADSSPFGRVLELLGGVHEIPEPAGLGARTEFGDVALRVAERGEKTFFGIGIETGWREVPAAMGLEMDEGVEPVAPAAEEVFRKS